ncbi:MAG: hypothetical protein KGH55_02275 [Nanoarchaeota archaeon]|nr:hypothetical protein [Nanoarchaeota archaeon]
MKISYLHIISVLLILALLFSSVEADIISFNAGGSTNITVSTDAYSEGTFNQIPTTTTTTGGGTTGGGVSGGGGGGVIIPGQNVTVSPTSFNVSMLINTNVQRTIYLTNLGNNSVVITLNQSGLDNMVILGNTTVQLAPGQVQAVSVIFVAPNSTGIYAGSIKVEGATIPVTLNVLKEFVLFDSNIVVLNKNYQVIRGQPLQTQVTLIPMGQNVRMDVTLDYAIKNPQGTVILTKSETMLVTAQKSIERDFDTGSLPVGNYTIDLQLIYPYGVAPSSAHFEVIPATSAVFSSVVYYIILAIFLIIALLIAITIARTIRRTRRAASYNRSSGQQVSSY